MKRFAPFCLLMLAVILTRPTDAAEPPARERLRGLERVAALLEPALKTDAGNADLLSILGTLYHRMGRIEDARRMFENTLALNDRDHSARFMLALIYEKTDDKEKAIAAWRKLRADCPYPSMRDAAERHLRLLE